MDGKKIDQPEPEIFGVFCGSILKDETERFISICLQTQFQNPKPVRIHILFQSWGGSVGDGVCLYNFIKNFPIEIVLYNSGQICSAGVMVYLGARKRVASKLSSFMIHRTSNSVGGNFARLQKISEDLRFDDDRTHKIYSERTRLPADLWEECAQHDIFFSGEKALEYGFVDELGEFSSPSGQLVYNLNPK